MTPIDLFYFIKGKYPECYVKSVCETETTCTREGYCDNKQRHDAIDFDKVKNIVSNGQKGDVPTSVDALCVGDRGEYFCFVELKGWQRYIDRISFQKRSIKDTTDKYNLSGKLHDSQNICMQVADDDDLFADMKVAFILVTDISVDDDGIGAFDDMMSFLSSASTDIYSQCVSNAKRTLDSEIHIRHDYVYCRDFDKYIKRL